MDPRDELRSHLRPASMAGAAIFATLGIYLALVEVFRSVLGPFRGFAAGVRMQPFRLAAYGAAAVVILLILVLRPRLFGRPGPQEDLRAAARRLQKASIVILVLGEIPAILGLVLFLAGGNAVDFYKLLFASLVLTFIGFPRRSVWEEWLKG